MAPLPKLSSRETGLTSYHRVYARCHWLSRKTNEDPETKNTFLSAGNSTRYADWALVKVDRALAYAAAGMSYGIVVVAF